MQFPVLKLLAACVLLLGVNAAALASYPEDSIYHLDARWSAQDGRQLSLADFEGKRVVLSMSYTTCEHTCPTIVSNMQAMERSLDPAGREETVFVLVSLLPRIDTPEVMAAYAEKRHLDGWVLLSGTDADVRMLAMILNVKYTPAGEREVSHSNLISVLDPAGRIERQITGLDLHALH